MRGKKINPLSFIMNQWWYPVTLYELYVMTLVEDVSKCFTVVKYGFISIC